MLTISSGHSVKYLTQEVAKGRENYYTGAVAEGEPPGRWYGRGAEKLGLAGLVDEQDMTALYEHFIDPRDPAFRDPSNWTEASTLGHAGRNYPSEDQIFERLLNAEPDADAERRQELREQAARSVRQNVAFLDATFSVQKSVTILHAAFEWKENQARRAGDETSATAWAEHRTAVEHAIWAGNNAMLDYLSEHAGYTRIGHHGGAGGRYADAPDWTVASFFQHDNRDHQPQLHVHNAILNRAEGPDGKWRTLDGKSLYAFRGAAAAVGERTTEEYLMRVLGVHFATRPDGKAREVVGVPAVLNELFSSRTKAITQHADGLVEVFRDKYGREPTPAERSRLEKRATFATRKAKSHTGETREQAVTRTAEETRTKLDGGFDQVITLALNAGQQPPEVERFDVAAVVQLALAELQASKAAWTPAELRRKISDKLPDRLGMVGRRVGELLDGLTAYGLQQAVRLDAAAAETAAVPDELRLADGRSAYEAPNAGLYALPEHVHSERALTRAATAAGAAAVDLHTARGFVAQLAALGLKLGDDQAAAVQGVLTSGARLESVVGPAGTGKSYVVGALAKAWADPELWGGARRRVYGLASSQIATEVLAGEGVEARNVARWLGTQRRLAEGRGVEEDHEWRLRGGDLVVVDESAMADTAALASILHHTRAAGAKLLLVGDHRQLAAIGAGGGMELAAAAGNCYELAEARRFTHGWERDASLRLREGDAAVLRTYHEHGRLRDGGALEQAEASAARAWLGDTLAGKQSLLLVDSNEQAARISAALRAELVRLGRVTEHGVPLSSQGTYAGLGDVVQARHNAWHLAGYQGNPEAPVNRYRYKVLDTAEDGGLTVARILGHTRDGAGDLLGAQQKWPASYVAEHVSLGYASTYHSGQGVTVATAHPVITPRTGADAVYVGMSRGKEANTGHVTTKAVPDDAETGEVNETVHRRPVAVLADTLEDAEPVKSATATQADADAEAVSMRPKVERLEADIELATAGRTAMWLDGLVDAGMLAEADRQRIIVEDGTRSLAGLLLVVEVAGHDPRQRLTDAVADRPFDGARRVSNVLYKRITERVDLEPAGDSYTGWLPRLTEPPAEANELVNAGSSGAKCHAERDAADPESAADLSWAHQWQSYLAGQAAALDERREQLAAETLADPPTWATLALGPVPDDETSRAGWAHKAGLVAAHRELSGHDDPYEPLGASPPAGQVQHYASWAAAWRALDRPAADRVEHEKTDAQLQLQIQAWGREQNWAPAYVGNLLAETIAEAERYRHQASVLDAEAQAATDDALRAQRHRQAAETRAVAELREHDIAQLREAEQAYTQWWLHTAHTRANADRAKAALAARNAAATRTAPAVTGEEWLAAEHQDRTTGDTYREITDEADFTDQLEPEPAPLPEHPAESPALETKLADVREAPAASIDQDAVRVPTAEEMTTVVHTAQRAVAEMGSRAAAEERRDAEASRAAQLARWHADDRAAEAEHTAERESAVHTPTLGDDQ